MPLAAENLPDRYVIEGILGAGAMGKVYRAFDTRLERPVAIKILEPRGDDPSANLAGALREARAAAAINHSNVASIFDAVQTEGDAFLVMELVPGTLLRRFVGDASVDVATRVGWLAGVASGLSAAHEVGVIHRDIKPDNVIVRPDGIAKILDFGVARVPPVRPAQASAIAEPHVTLSGGASLVGTPSYMAPEQIENQEIDGRTDQFGWGVVAYELLTGTLPWRAGDASFRMLISILRDEPPPFAAELGIPDEVAAVVMRALAKSRADRFDSMAEVVAALAPFASPLSSKDSGTRVRSPFSSPPPSPKSYSVRPSPPASTPPSTVVSARALEGPPAVTPTLRPPAAPGSFFRDPDFAAPVDLQAQLDLLPPGATLKGMYFKRILAVDTPPGLDLFALAGVRRQRYLPFGDYPASDFMQLAVVIAREAHGGVPLGEGLRRLGALVPGALLGSLVGRTILGVHGADAEAFILSTVKALRISLNFGEVAIEKAAPGRFLLHLHHLPLFLETFRIGVLEGLLAQCGAPGRVRIALQGLADATFEITLG